MKVLLEELQAYDGKSTAILGETQARHGSGSSYAADLVDLAASAEAPDSANVSDGATWLLKAHLESGGMLSAATTRRLFETLDQITAWQAQLHFCQMMAHLNIPAYQAAAVAAWLSPLLQHKRPFLRAWSMNALQHVAAQYPAFAANAAAALTAAEGDSAASVRARARKVRAR